MSETEFRIGRLKEVAKDKDTFDEKINAACEEFEIDKDSLDIEDGYLYGTDKLVYAKGRLFLIVKDSDIEELGDLSVLNKVGEDEYDYMFRYYNGGTYFTEMLEDALE